jgi:hypothetical protein
MTTAKGLTPTPSAGAWFTTMDGPRLPRPVPSYWVWVLCLLGVDYFSTLAYQPSITFQVAGRLGPLATVVVVLATLCGALPVYWYVAGKSPHGRGSIALLEQIVHGWRGKTLVLLLLGFAATDFVMIKTISLADAAEHVLGNDYAPWHGALHAWAAQSKELTRDHLGARLASYFDEQLIVTILLGAVGFAFWFLLRKGFSLNVLRLAVPLVGLYLLLNALVIGSGVAYLADNPERLDQWCDQVGRGDWLIPQQSWGAGAVTVAALCLFFLPKLALGLSGFEMSMIVMPQVRGGSGDTPDNPRGRIRNTRKVLLAAALIMSAYLLGSVLVTTTLIPAEAFRRSGPAANRALAYLAHGSPLAAGSGPEQLNSYFGPLFGSVYDLITVLLLCLAGTSVMTALAVLLPQFLLRFGMELKSAHRWGVLLIVFALINLAVTLYFRAQVTDQRGAYATGVLVLLSSAAVAAVSARKGPHRGGRLLRFPWGFALIAAVFVATTLTVMIQTPSGLLIAGGFIVAILVSSVLSRAVRANEMRTVGFDFVDEESKFLWDSLVMADFPVLVPHRPGRHERDLKEVAIRRDHQLAPEVEIVFIEVEVDDPSNFYQRLLIEVVPEGTRFVIRVTRCSSVAHAIAAIALEMSRFSKPPGLHFGWSEMDLLVASWSYLAFGEGNIPWKVRELIRAVERAPEKQPRVIIG